MRVATFVLGLTFAAAGGATEVSDSGAAVSARVPTTFGAPVSDGLTAVRDSNLRSGVIGVMGFVPAQHPSSFSGLPIGDSAAPSTQRYNPAKIPLPATRTLEDHLLTGFVALMLIAYQLRRKHRFLRPHQFST